jgi:hypothetical protein
MEVCEDHSKQDPVGKSIAALVDLCMSDRKLDLFWSSASFNSIASDDRQELISWLGDSRLIIVYPRVPKRMPRINGFEIWTLTRQELKFHCLADDFDAKRSEIMKLYEEPSKFDVIIDEMDELG